MTQTTLRQTTRLRQLLASPEIVVAPGAYDGLSARLVERAGFPAVYASGGAIARSNALPDLGLMSLSESVDRLTSMVRAVSIPLIADADTGYGNVLNLRRTIQDFERSGAAGAHIEDQTFPKKCGHYDDKGLIPAEEMAQKIRAACDARTDPDFVIIARTDAIAVEGYESALKRAELYRDAGADILFVEAPVTEEQVADIPRRLGASTLINMFKGGKTPLVPVERLQALGYRIVIIPSDLQRAAIAAMQSALSEISQSGSTEKFSDRMVSFQDREEVVGTKSFLEFDDKYAV